MDDVLAETACTYPETYVQTMTGRQIKDILEDVCDNLFNPDPYYQQGGDMVRVGGLSYACAPAESAGHRISDLKLGDGRSLEAGKSYKVAGWASVNKQDGAPVWDVFARHLRNGMTSGVRRDSVTLKGVDGNPGLAG
jgi:sulfur-oxidizing protein SoxB